MAQQLRPPAAPPVLRNADLMAAKLGLHEGVRNHLSAMLPGRDDLFLVNPIGRAFDHEQPEYLT